MEWLVMEWLGAWVGGWVGGAEKSKVGKSAEPAPTPLQQLRRGLHQRVMLCHLIPSPAVPPGACAKKEPYILVAEVVLPPAPHTHTHTYRFCSSWGPAPRRSPTSWSQS